MTQLEISETEWGLQLWGDKNVTIDDYLDRIERVSHKPPVHIAWVDDHAEITDGKLSPLHTTRTMDDAFLWCRQFELPIQVISGNAYEHLLRELNEWLGEQGNDKALSTQERAAYFNVQAKVNQLMREAK
jgi:hypothetical protein